MCIAFPKAADGGYNREQGWKSASLLIPRSLALSWILLKLLGQAALGQLLEKRPQARWKTQSRAEPRNDSRRRRCS